MDDEMAEGMRGYRAALRFALVRRLTGATTASVIGDYLGIGALLVMAADRTGGLAIGPAAVFASAVPVVVVVGVLGGAVLDRLPRIPALVSFELLGAAIICLPLVIDGVAIVFVTAGLLAGQRTATGAIRQGVIADGVPEAHRAPLVAITTAVDQGGQVVGYLTGAAVYLLISPAAALLLNAGAFLVAALVLFGVRLPAEEDVDGQRRTAPRSGPGAGFAIIREQPVLRLFFVLVIATAGVGALPETLAPTVLDADDARASLLLAAAPLGQAVTITVLGRTRLVGRPWFQLGHLGLLAAALAVAAAAPGVGGLIAANLLVGAGVAWVLGPQLTFLRLVPPARMAQVTGLMWAVIAVAEGGGAIALGTLADATGPRSAYLAAAALIALAAVPGAIAARRSPAVAELDHTIRAEITAARS